MKKYLKEQRGITLVVLVVTVVVLAILISIIVSTAIGDNGVISQARQAEENELNMQQAFQNRIEALKNETIPSGGGVANIIDGTAPVINNIEIIDVTSSSITIKVNGQEIESGVNSIEYGISTAQNISNYSQDATSSSATTHTFYNLLDYTTYNIGVRVTDKSSNTNTYTTTATTVSNLEVAKSNNMLNKQDNTRIKVQNNFIWIPAGYKVASDSGLKIDDGIVITDSASNGNEWVWVPVADASTLYSTENTPVAITGGSGNTYVSGVSATKYSKSNIVSSTERGLPNTTSYREPDVVIYKVSDSIIWGDNRAGNRLEAGFTKIENGETITMTLSEMAQTMVDEYNQMIASINKYGGFYIGRYELSGTVDAPKLRRGENARTGNWYSQYKACKGLVANNNSVISRMIWGCQWDATCNFIRTNSSYSITSTGSRRWGNYKNSLSPANVVVNGVNKYGEKQVTGYSENWKAKNIYDFAGNIGEWTQEASGSKSRISRGGNYLNSTTSNQIVTKRDGYDSEVVEIPYVADGGDVDYNFGTRPTLILLP